MYVKSTFGQHHLPRPSQQWYWKPSKAGKVKINTNTAKITDRQWRLGAVIRDDSGTVIAIATKEWSGSFTTNVFESLALLRVVELSIQNIYTTMEVKSDCELTVKAFHSGHDVSLMDSIMQNLRLIFALCSFFSLPFVRRSCNVVAHQVAKHGCGLTLVFSCASFPFSMMRLADVDLKVFLSKA